MTSEKLTLDQANNGGSAAREETAGTARKKTNWWAEARAILLLILAVLAFHSLVAKPFYIPSESMLPTLRVGDRLIVTKYPYGYSYITPTFHVLPFMHGRLFGHMPKRGDIVIVVPPGKDTDYIKRVIGLPGDRIGVAGGTVYLNGVPLKQKRMGTRDIPVDGNTKCSPDEYPGMRVRNAQGKWVCRVPIVREWLPSGRYYDTIDLGYSPGDNYPEITVPKGKVFLMGDNRDNSADSRYPLSEDGLGGPVPWENIGGRAEFITFSLDGNATWNPLTWIHDFRPGRTGLSLHPKQAKQ
ncbi:signal peptidase I [Stakelama sediminis]|uniref:Signal peptidase I n=1 Tax=Stakelama sediminis TaxID=463200 RepID=A0A840YW28_9SPHN|nr:signal peptidase I [Stakelama sediminis]MBB5717749.1 signal peptidase I [Stakelama sediminis]